MRVLDWMDRHPLAYFFLYVLGGGCGLVVLWYAINR
jgi:hypothetical protein